MNSAVLCGHRFSDTCISNDWIIKLRSLRLRREQTRRTTSYALQTNSPSPLKLLKISKCRVQWRSKWAGGLWQLYKAIKGLKMEKWFTGHCHKEMSSSAVHLVLPISFSCLVVAAGSSHWYFQHLISAKCALKKKSASADLMKPWS